MSVPVQLASHADILKALSRFPPPRTSAEGSNHLCSPAVLRIQSVLAHCFISIYSTRVYPKLKTGLWLVSYPHRAEATPFSRPSFVGEEAWRILNKVGLKGNWAVWFLLKRKIRNCGEHCLGVKTYFVNILRWYKVNWPQCRDSGNEVSSLSSLWFSLRSGNSREASSWIRTSRRLIHLINFRAQNN